MNATLHLQQSTHALPCWLSQKGCTHHEALSCQHAPWRRHDRQQQGCRALCWPPYMDLYPGHLRPQQKASPGLGAGTWLGKHLRGYTHWRRRRRARYRSIPGAGAQFGLLFRRAGVKWVRNWGYKFVDLLLYVAAALVVGAPLHGAPSALAACWDTAQVVSRSLQHPRP